MAVWLDDRGDPEELVASVEAELKDQPVGYEPTVPPGELETMHQATDFESRASIAIAVVAAIAATFFVGQAVARQARSESADARTLLALGMRRRHLAAATALRWLPVALAAASLAVVVTLAASMLGPMGVARRGPWDRGIRVDSFTLVFGALTVAGLVMVIALAAARPRGGYVARRTAVASPAAIGAVGVRAGIGLAWRSLGRESALPLASAVFATALAIALVIAAAGGSASLKHVTTNADRYGAPWDVLITGDEAAAASVQEIAGIESAAWIVGTNVALGDDPQVWVQALVSVPDVDVTRPVIVAGRAPAASDEVALGLRTLRGADASIGDEVTLEGPTGGEPLRYRVVGETMVTDGYEPNVGDGGLVTPEGLARVEPNVEPGDIALRLDAERRDETIAALREAFPGARAPFPVPSSLANADRIAGLPLLLAMGAGAIAAVTLTHALVTTTRRNRHELAVCRVIGFTRGQVHTAGRDASDPARTRGRPRRHPPRACRRELGLARSGAVVRCRLGSGRPPVGGGGWRARGARRRQPRRNGAHATGGAHPRVRHAARRVRLESRPRRTRTPCDMG